MRCLVTEADRGLIFSRNRHRTGLLSSVIRRRRSRSFDSSTTQRNTRPLRQDSCKIDVFIRLLRRSLGCFHPMHRSRMRCQGTREEHLHRRSTVRECLGFSLAPRVSWWPLCAHPRSSSELPTASFLGLLRISEPFDHAFVPIRVAFTPPCCARSRRVQTLLLLRLPNLLPSLLPESQHGFRKERSTRHPLWHYTHTIWQAINSRQRTIGVSMDLSSAYDRVSPQILRSKLKTWKMPEGTLHTICSLLENRTNQIDIQDQSFQYSPTRGLPQGSPLSPILYALYSADIPECIPETVHVQMYADDVLLYQTLRPNNNTEDIQQALDEFEQWCRTNHMKLNIEKTQYVIYQRNRDKTLPTLNLCGTPLRPGEEMKYLGITFDDRMTFTSHLNNLIAKAGRRLNTIRRLTRTFWGAAPTILRTLYQSCIQPIIQYGAETWITRLNCQGDSRRIDRIARLASLAITGLNRTTSAETATALAHITPPSDLTLWTLLKTAPAALRRQEEPHKSATAEAHCTPLNLLRAELGRIPNKTREEQQPRQHTRKEDQEVKCLIEDEDYKDVIQKYFEDRTDRLWKTADKSQDLKRTGWIRRTGTKPWFSSTAWKRPAVSRINQVLSGHSPTREYLQRRGHENEDISWRLCGKHPETRDHMFRCEALKQQRQQIFLHEQVPIEGLGTLVQEANLYYSLDEYCKIIYQTLERGPQP